MGGGIVKILELLVESKQSSAKLFKVEIDGEITTLAKQCGKCDQIKTLDKFHIDKGALGGVNTNCKECRSDRKTPKRKVVKLIINGLEVDGIDCTGCKILKPLTEFAKGNGVGGVTTRCFDCSKEYRDRNRERIRMTNKEYRDNNPEKMKEFRRVFTDNNPTYHRDYYRIWRPKNKDRTHKYYIKQKPQHKLNMEKWYAENKEYHNYLKKVNGIKRRAIDNYLIGNCSMSDIISLKEYFNNECSLTYSKENIQLDHFIPISIGHGGSYVGNLIPLSEPLNRSKFNKNPFEWIKQEDVKIDTVKWNKLIEYLSETNKMSIDEYHSFVYWCFDNKRSLEDLEKNKTSSIELWKQNHEVLGKLNE
jgi:hypothetical protein